MKEVASVHVLQLAPIVVAIYAMANVQPPVKMRVKAVQQVAVWFVAIAMALALVLVIQLVEELA